jgi:hypothetical protein
MVSAWTAQTVIASCERSDVEKVATFLQGFGNTFASERMFIDYRYHDRRISFSNIGNWRL